jgi:hypothetical protein
VSDWDSNACREDFAYGILLSIAIIMVWLWEQNSRRIECPENTSLFELENDLARRLRLDLAGIIFVRSSGFPSHNYRRIHVFDVLTMSNTFTRSGAC